MYVNGRERSVQHNVTLFEFLEKKGYDMLRVAVEKNGSIVPKNTFETETLSNDDRLEIVTFVGGG